MKKLICTILALVIALSFLSVSVSANEITEDFPDEPIDDTHKAIVLDENLVAAKAAYFSYANQHFLYPHSHESYYSLAKII